MKQTYTTHDLTSYSMGEAYDFTQYSDTVKDGDVLLVLDGIAIMFKAWPVMVTGDSEVFHSLDTSDKPADEIWMHWALTNENGWVDYPSRWYDITSNPEKVRAAAVATVEACEAWDNCGNPTLGA